MPARPAPAELCVVRRLFFDKEKPLQGLDVLNTAHNVMDLRSPPGYWLLLLELRRNFGLIYKQITI